jgi:hypothetical protein
MPCASLSSALLKSMPTTTSTDHVQQLPSRERILLPSLGARDWQVATVYVHGAMSRSNRQCQQYHVTCSSSHG